MESQLLMIMTIGLTIINVICCIAASAIGVYAWVELKSFMKSTHKIEFVPFDPLEEENKKKEARKSGKRIQEPLQDEIFNEYGMTGE